MSASAETTTTHTMTGPPPPAPKLAWERRDNYHLRSTCERFSVCRMTTAGRVWYIAWRRPAVSGRMATELGARDLPETASEAERKAVRLELQAVCEAAAVAEDARVAA